LLLLFAVSLPVFAGTITGQIQTATGGAIKNGTLTFALSQPGVLSGTASVASSAVSCYTDNSGNVVGVPDPIVPPSFNTNSIGGPLSAGTYYIKIAYSVSGNTTVSNVSPEATVVLSSGGQIFVTSPTVQPTGALAGYNVYASTTSGTETYQGTALFGNQFTINSIVAGSAPPSSNNTVCSLIFSDQLIPTGTYYTVSLTNRNGSTIAGFPQTWCTYGGGAGTINVSNGAPTGNCNVNGVFYPTPIFANPQNNGAQSISGPISFTTVTACKLNGVETMNPGCFAGADIGAQINAAYASCPANGCIIQLPSGTYAYSTPIVFDGSHGPVNFRCEASPQGTPVTQSAVQLIFTPTTGAAITYNDGGTGAAGLQGCTFFGPGRATAAIGLVCGSGSAQCDGHVFADSGFTGFGVGVQLGGLFAFLNTFLNDDLGDNGINLNMVGSGGNEENKFIGGILSNQRASPANCVDTTNAGGPYDMEFIGVSLDQCDVTINGSTGHRFRFIGSHLEHNPGFITTTPFITIGTNCSQCNLQLDSTDVLDDGNAGRTSFILDSNTSLGSGGAAVIINGGRFFCGAGSGFPIIHDPGGVNLASVVNVYKSGAATSDVDAGLQYISSSYGTINIVGSGSALPSLTIAGPTPDISIAGTTSSLLGLKPSNVSPNLPTCSAGLEGWHASVNNSNTATYGATIAGGGSNHVPVYCNGTNWVVD
jgi:hypothetical protein